MKKILYTLAFTLLYFIGFSQSDCNNPLALTPGVQQCGTNSFVGSFDDGGLAPTNPCNSSYNDGEYWFSYTANAAGDALQLDVSGLSDTYSGIYVLDNCPANSPNCIASHDNSSSTANYSITTPALNPGQTYYIVIANWSLPYQTDFCLDATELTIVPTCSDGIQNQGETGVDCGGPCPACGVGVDCANSNVIAALPYSISTTTCGAGDDYSSTDACGSSYMNGEDYVFEYTPSVDEDINIDLTTTGTWPGVFVLDDCPDAVGANCIATGTSSGSSISMCGTPLTAGQTYYIVVSTYPSPDCIPFDINITSTVPTQVTINTCNGTFYDTGGAGSNYSPCEHTITTYCPSTAGMVIQVDFTQWDVESGTNDDQLTVYDGDDNTAPLVYFADGLNSALGMVQASQSNASGCLTFEWISDDDATTGLGWTADISCTYPCQLIQAVWDGSTPTDNANYIDICQGGTVTFNAHGSYPENNNSYFQSDANSTFTWYFGDGTTATGTSVTHTYPNEGGYNVDLVITDQQGCESTNSIDIRVRVSMTPTFTGTSTNNANLCLGDCANLTGVNQEYTFDMPTGQVLADTTFLPDGTGVTYTTDLTFTNFTPGQVVTQASDVVEICMEIEHSYLGDLDFVIVCPNGQSVSLLDGDILTNGTSSVAWFGIPNETDNTPLTDPTVNLPGTPWTYCFDMTSATTITASGTGSDTSIPAGNYLTENSFDGLIGCPLNGTWSIEITDDIGSDNGWIYSWGIDFDPSIYPPLWSFTNTVVGESWSGNGVGVGNPTTACPTSLGNNDYIYSVTDNFGCTYDTTISINVIGLNVTTAFTNPTCNGGSNGTASVTNVTGNIGALSYSWSTGSTNSSISGLAAGTYTVTVTDGGASCTATETITITNPPALTITATPTNETCDGANDGAISISVTNGTGPYDITWSPGTTANNQTIPYNVTSLADNTYLITVTDNNGCSVTGSAIVNPGPATIASIANETNQCLLGNSFTFDGSGSTPVGGTYSWDFGDGNTGTGATPTHSYVTANNYTVTLTYTNGACSDQATINFQVYPQPIASAIVDNNVLCFGDATGQATASGGTSYAWSSGGTSATESGLAAGTYTVTVTDANFCTNTTTVTIAQPNALQISTAVTAALCNGASDGIAQCNIDQVSTSPYDYAWSNGNTTTNTTSLTNSINDGFGTYTVTVTDDNGCTATANASITEPTVLTVSATGTDGTCDLSNGSINLTSSGATPVYTYNWTGPSGYNSSIEDPTGLAAGTYNYTVTDANNCTYNNSVIIGNSGLPVITISSTTNPTCNGVCDGTASTSLTTTTTAPYTYAWSSGGASSTETGLCGDGTTYTVTVTDAYSCTATASTVLSQPPVLTASVTVTDASCNGVCDATATVTAGGGSGAYTYSWNNTANSTTTTTAADLCGDGTTYTVIVADAADASCTVTATITPNQPTAPTITEVLASHVDVDCNGNSTGALEVTGGGGTPGYQYNIDGGANQASGTFTGLAAGTYTLEVEDANGCTQNMNITITEPNVLTVSEILANHVDVTCNGGNNGSLTAQAAGGTTAYQYSIDGGTTWQATGTFGSLSAGTYTIDVLDANNCVTNMSITITEPTPLTATIPAVALTCNGACDGQATVTAGGGSGAYTYSWDNTANSSTATTAADLCGSTTYTVIVADAVDASCTVTATITPTEPTALTATVTATDASCNGVCDATATVTASGGSGAYNYSWNNTANSTTAITAADLCGDGTTYTVIVADVADASCTVTATITPNQPTAPTITEVLVSHVDVDCNGNSTGVLEVTGGGGTPGYQYNIDGGANQASGTFTGLAAGTYTLEVVDANGCTQNMNITITEPNVLTVSEIIANHVDVTCNGGNNGSLTAQAADGTGPYQYSIDGGTTWQATGTFGSLSAGTYTIDVLDAHNCVTNMSVTIIEPTPLTATIPAVALTCNGACDGQATVTAGGGSGAYTYSWDNTANSSTATTAADLCGGTTYTVIVADAADVSCTVTATITPTEPTALTATVTATDASCNGVCDATATVTAGGGSGAYNYSWNNTANSTTATTAADLCGDGTTYTVIVADAADASCTVTATIIPNQPAAPTITEVLASHVDVDCNGNSTGALEVTGGGGTPGYQYNIDGGANQASGTFTGLAAGTYTLEVEDANGCTQNMNITITEPNALTISEIIANHVDVTCNGGNNGSLTAQAADGTGPYQYSIDGGTTWQATGTFGSLSAGTYTIDVLDAHNCVTNMSITITEPTPLTASIPAVVANCNGICDAQATVTAGGGSGAYTYIWDNATADNTATTTANLCGDGTIYSVTVADAADASCTVTTTITPTEPAAIVVTPSSQNANCGAADGQVDVVSIVGGSGTYTGYLWEDGTGTQVGTTANVTGLIAGTYYLTVTDNNGCTGITNVTIDNNAAGSVTVDLVTDVNCNGAFDGAINVTESGGATPLIISWTGPNGFTSALEDISGLEAGSYTINITDNNGCVASANAIVNEPTAVTAVPTLVNDVTCFGGSDGSVTVTPNGGTITTGYTYEWFTSAGVSTGQTTQTASGLTAGDYYVVVSDNSTPACSVTSANVAISEPTLLTASAIISSDYNGENISCNGAFDGSIDLTATDGTPTYTYNWTGPNGFTSALEDISGLEAGTYDVTVTDANSCTQVVSITLTEPVLLTITTSVIDANCGQADGSVDVPTITGGTAGYTYNWEDNTATQIGTTANVTNLLAGTYDITVTDVNGCIAISSATINDNAAGTVTIDLITDVNCNGGSDGAIDITATGTAPLTYDWTGPGTYTSSNEDISGLIAGNYTINVTDGVGCVVSANATVNEPTAITAVPSLVQDVSCYGGNDGSVTVTPNGGTVTTGYTYEWFTSAGVSTGQTTQNASGLPAGDYYVVVSDNATPPCTFTSAIITISEPTQLTASAVISSDYNGENISCNGAFDGSIDLTAANGTPTYTFNWSGPNGFISAFEDISGLEAGTYDVTVTDANSCTQVVSVTLTEPVLLTITTSVIDAHCGQADGSVDVPTITGGTAGYTYNWEDNTATQIGTTANITNILAGTYDITVTDVNGCIAISSATINDLPGPNDIAIVIDNDVTVLGACDGQATVTMTGATSWQWYDDNTYTNPIVGQTSSTAIGLCAQEYCVIVTDANGCTDQACVTIVEPGAISVTGIETHNLCNADCNGVIDITATGGIGAPYTFNWEDDANPGTSISTNEDLTGLCAGSYSVTVTDANGAIGTYSATITEPTLLTASAIISSDYNGENISCNGAFDGAIDLTVANGTPTYTYSWTGPNGFISAFEDISGLEAGTYDVTVTDANSCTQVVSVTLTEPVLLTITTSVIDAHCGQADGSVDVPTITGGTAGYTYNWEDNTATQIGTTANITNILAGTYDITVTDVNGCIAISSATINDLPGPNDIAIVIDNDVTVLGACDGQATVTMTGATSWQWYDDNTYTNPIVGQTSATATGLCAQEYCVIVTDANGCTDQACVTIVEPGAISVTGIETHNLCNADCNGVIDITATGGIGAPYTFNWEDDANPGTSISTNEDLTGLCAGSYSVTVTDANGAIGTYSATITEPTLLTASAVISSDYNGENISCNGAFDGAIDLTVANGTPTYTFNWNGPNGFSASTEDINGLEAGTYDVTVTDVNGCSEIISTTLTEPTAIILATSANDAFCGQANGDVDTLSVSGGTGAYTYNWEDGVGTQVGITPAVVNLASGTYYLTVSDINNCTATSSANISDIGGAVVSISILSQPLCTGDTNAVAVATVTTTSTAPYSFDWDNGLIDNLNTNDVTDTVSGLTASILYNLVLTDANGCQATAQIQAVDPSPVDATIGAFTDILCNGGNTGSATAGAHGGTVVADYTYLWSAGASPTDATDTGLVAGTYQVTVYDDNMCYDTTSVTLVEPTQLQISVTSYTDETCQATNGDITISAIDGTPGYTYLWDANAGSATTTTVSNLDGDITYWVTVTDANGCTATTNQYIDTIPIGIATITSLTDITCFGYNDGTATVSIASSALPFSYNWSNGYSDTLSSNASSTAIGLSQGLISVNITDSNGCVISASTTINEPTQLANTFTVDTLECNAATDATITTNITGGTILYTYAWDNATFSTDSFITNIGAGMYHVTITDNNGCSIIDSMTIVDPPAMSLAFISSNSSCNQSDGSIDMTVTNPTAPMSYLWSDGTGFTANTEDITNIPAGTYNVTVTNGNACTITGSTTVIDDSGPTATIIDSADVTCAGASDGYATVDGTGGTGAGTYSFLWSDASAQNSATATNLSGGTYTVSVTDLNGCVATTSITINEPDTLDFNLATFDPLCNGGTDGWASVTPFGGTAPYIYNWTGTGTNPNDSLFIGLSDGFYSIQITDANGCDTILNNIAITEPPFISASSTTVDVLCFGGNNGAINVMANGGTVSSGYGYQWDANANNQTTSTANNLSAGTYSVVITDDNNCTLTYSATVNEPTQLVIDTLQATNLLCYQSADGFINTYVSGGTPAYTYQWATGTNANYSTIEDIGGLDADTYFLTVTDNNGCTIDTFITVNEPTQLTLSLNATDETCYQYCDGIINSVVTGGTPTYSYLWSDNSTTSDLTNACPGTYNLTVTDNNACTSSWTETINAAPQLFINVDNVVETSCGGANGEIEISIGGGNGTISIDWDVAVNNANSSNIGMPHVIDLLANNYYLQITDGNGCQVDTTIAVNNIGGPILDSVVVTDVTCFGDCDGDVTVYYHQPIPAATPYTLTWQGYPAYTNQNTIDNRCEGTYYFEVSDANGCIISGSGQVNSPTEVTSAISSVTDATCNGTCNGNATVNPSGGIAPYTYSWTNGDLTQTASDLCAGTYQVIVSDAHNCTSTSTTFIAEPSQLTINLDYITDVSCNGFDDGAISIIAQGGSNLFYYDWVGTSTTNSTISNLIAGNTYTVVVTDQNDINCFVSETYTVTEPNPIVITTGSTNITCNSDNGSAFITNITGGTPTYAYSWSPCNTNCNSDMITGLNDGIYQLQVIDNNGCTEDVQVSVYDTPPPYLFAQTTTDVNCFGGNDGIAIIEIKEGTQPYDYDWSAFGTNDSIATNLMAQTYWVTVTDADGCEVVTTFTIDQPTPIEIFADGPNLPVCINQETFLTVNANGGTNPYHYYWGDTTLVGSPVTVYPLNDTVYTVYAIDGNGCQSNPAQVSINVYPPIHVTVSPDVNICLGESTTLTAVASGGNYNSTYTYTWHPTNIGNPITVSPINTTTYYVWANDNCKSPSDTANVTVNISLSPQITSVLYNEGCEPLDATLGVTLADTNMIVNYLWNLGEGGYSSTESNPQHLYVNSGSYDIGLTLTSVNGCQLDTVLAGIVNVFPNPDAAFYTDKERASIFDAMISCSDNTDDHGYPVTWSWDFGDGSPMASNANVSHIYEESGYYTIMLAVVNSKGCVDTVYNNIEIYDEHRFYMPNAFRPNQDHWYYPKGIGISEEGYHFTIYNRWGEIIFETTQYPEGTDVVDRLGKIEGGWNGRYMNTGKVVQSDIYVWLVQVVDVNGYQHEYSGWVNVIR